MLHVDVCDGGFVLAGEATAGKLWATVFLVCSGMRLFAVRAEPLCVCVQRETSQISQVGTLRQDSHFSKVVVGVCLSTSHLAGYLKNDSKDVDGIHLKHSMHL